MSVFSYLSVPLAGWLASQVQQSLRMNSRRRHFSSNLTTILLKSILPNIVRVLCRENGCFIRASLLFSPVLYCSQKQLNYQPLLKLWRVQILATAPLLAILKFRKNLSGDASRFGFRPNTVPIGYMSMDSLLFGSGKSVLHLKSRWLKKHRVLAILFQKLNILL